MTVAMRKIDLSTRTTEAMAICSNQGHFIPTASNYKQYFISSRLAAQVSINIYNYISNFSN